MTKANFGVVGMAVMGRNLAPNIESRGLYSCHFTTVVKENRRCHCLPSLKRTLCQAMTWKAL